ncbi:phospholipase D-like domain-containing protein [Halomonas sp. SpR1]|uniref:phospholipase D-like domain-containing protein n=1 Tax=Halomonas sp. SpR1 TaxID=3050462 RepID=UPI0027E51CB5|nr:phospholipase D-like domain-containing protein [Halomonas sp. SpR1]MDQ7733788.1 phospholipase D-like domain-containing protein [Halomonas sp. SpR1]
MISFSVHPGVYQTSVETGLRNILEDMWIRSLRRGDGTIFIISGFANYNGGARFYKILKEHTENGGRVVAILGGSASQRLSSKQVVHALLECGAEVFLINRKRILHAKCYGFLTENGEQSAVITSGNFTAPGLSQNIEASVYLKNQALSDSSFSWCDLVNKMFDQNWQYYQCLIDPLSPHWNLLYDETPQSYALDEVDQETLIVKLVPTDTNRILANPGDISGRGSQYFWLSKDCFDFFPPLTIRNQRGWKGTLSAFINLNYVDLGISDQVRITFEAENNLDFRLGTGRLRYTKMAEPGDLACITRISEDSYELRIIRQNNPAYQRLDLFAPNFIGSRGKRYGYIDSQQFFSIL